MPELKIGTCSWKYDSWRGIIYSQNSKINYLNEYASHFDTVEVDQWFWSLHGVDKISLPLKNVVDSYQRSVPDNFKFTIKVPNSVSLTNFYKRSKTNSLEPNPFFLSNELFNQFLESIKPLWQNLGPLMFQFEYLNKQKMKSQLEFQKQFSTFIEKCNPQFIYAMEIRNPNYLNQEYFEFLNKNNVAHVFLQGYYMPDMVEVYNKLKEYIKKVTVIRLHGPDRKQIEEKSGGDWSKIYEPKDSELIRVSKMILDLLSRDVDVYLNVNNHYEGSAPLTIDKIRNLLKNDFSI